MRRPLRHSVGRPLVVTASLLVAGTVGAVASSGCSSAPVDTTVRSLQSSGPLTFVCLGDDSLGLDELAHPLDDCGPTTLNTSDGDSEGDFTNPHLYALVTQPNSGQVAVVDLTTNAVIDTNPKSPFNNFLPVGALPTAIVSTPGSTATFVSSAEANYEGIYGLPSDMIRSGAPHLTSWPACALPAAPGEMVLVVDPANDEGAVRPSCDSAYGATTPAAPDCNDHCRGDLERDLASIGETGRLKLVVTLPSEGGIAVIDEDAGGAGGSAVEPPSCEGKPCGTPCTIGDNPGPPAGQCTGDGACAYQATCPGDCESACAPCTVCNDQECLEGLCDFNLLCRFDDAECN